MHRIHFCEIQKDRYGDREDLKRFVVNSVPMVVAHNVPFIVIRDIQNSQNPNQIATNLFRNVMTSNEDEPQKRFNYVHLIINAVDDFLTEINFTPSPL
ncbi:unnamed protein product [Rotaria magnacalcarata]|uniref:Uncharacterized protein n=1 Tax=Rotaria magnacalcarata TaxID=392030 RepID=A0A819TTC4_9BILA|nr:unnamed protein product [Rotaria magnacalcarata]